MLTAAHPGLGADPAPPPAAVSRPRGLVAAEFFFSSPRRYSRSLGVDGVSTCAPPSGHLKVRSLWPYATLAFGMALLGAWTLREVSEADWLERSVPLLLLLAAGYFGFVRLPQASLKAIPVFGILAVAGIATIGFYDGFFGPGTGSLFALLMISGLGLSLRDATIHAKLFNAMTNFAAFLLFVTSDLVNWSAVAVMIPAQILGALVGTRAMLGRGIVLIRPLVVLMCTLMAIKLASEAWLP